MKNRLPHRLDRTVTIRARPAIIFQYFTNSERWAAWWGAGSTIDARPGGPVFIRHPGGMEVVGEVTEIQEPERIVFTYGYASGSPIPPSSSRVTIWLEPAGASTLLHLTHEFPDTAMRDEHVQGWRFQLSLFANVVANEIHADAATTVDAWFRAWSISDAAARMGAFAHVASTDICLRDRFSLVVGLHELVTHAGAYQQFMPGLRLERRGDVRHCQGTVLADWASCVDSGAGQMSGTCCFTLSPDNRIEAVTNLITC